ncbi:MAG: Zinc ABC transporter, periplasmic-binding protein ZnuA [uncultured Sulfurovum sp.]|uniref:Zinc ABC transporter, periplasmic-binding protein ZnuA n=1 Tax=uncultured Sulfurovum sp. TaxID=269237 RepID=A0A6S6TH07_9BACT|nr:MAG: Zinc ABC transporter, periplasmic-binding protein ZnuA [uncultured Sulfurovum sp.]
MLTLFILTANTLYAKVHAVVSILPQQTFVEKIGGDKVHVTTMVKPGSDPHTYAPKPSQMVALAKADIYFPIKVGFENAWLEKFAYHNQKMQFSNMTKGIKFMGLAKANYAYKAEKNNEKILYEWAGVFSLKKGTYYWSFSKVFGKYADPTMKFLMLQTTTKNDVLIVKYKKGAEALFHLTTPTLVKDADVLNSQQSFYQLSFDETKKETIFKLDIQESGNYLFFTEHMPFEFEDKEHFLKDTSNHNIEPIVSDPENASHHHHHGGLDPHTWTAPSNVKIMAKNIYETLVKLDNENENYYEENYKKFLEEIEETDRQIKEILLSVPQGSKFMVFHPSWGYFAKEYGLVQMSVEVEGKAPKPRILKQIIEEAHKQNIKAIFTQKEFSDKSAKVIAHELNIKVLKETPLARDWSTNLIKKANAIANNQ